MACEHSFPIIPKGSKAPKSSDLRGQVKFKLMTVSEDLMFPDNCKSKTLPVQTVYLIHFTASWISIRVERVGVAPSGWGTRAAKICSWSVTAVRRTASLIATSNRTTSRRTTSSRTTSRLGFVERSFRERFLEKSFSQTAGLPGRTTSRGTTSHKRLARTAKTNLESLLLECLLLHLCVLARAHHRVVNTDCAEKGFCCASSTPCGNRVWSTPNKSSAG